MNRIVKYFILLLISAGYSLSLEQTLENMAQDNAKGYLGSMVTVFGMNLNSGTFHNAKPHKLLGFDFKLGVSMTSVSDEGKTFNFVLPDASIPVPITISSTPYNLEVNPDNIYESDRVSSTLFGVATENSIVVDTDAAKNSIANQLAVQLGGGMSAEDVINMYPGEIENAIDNSIPSIPTPVGFNLSTIPMIIPQISIGLPKDIEISYRGMPSADLGDMGKVTFSGFGGKIGLNQFIPMPNIVLPHFSIGYYMTNLEVGDIVKMSNSITTLQISKSIPVLTIYGGFGFESSSLDVDYKYTDELTSTEVPIKFTIEGENNFRTTIGARLKLAIITINADYNMGEFNTVNFGAGLTLR